MIGINCMTDMIVKITKLLDSEYAELVSPEDIHSAEHIWYLPHHAILNHNKPDKLHVVFDCATRYGG